MNRTSRLCIVSALALSIQSLGASGPAAAQSDARCATVNVLTAAERTAGWQLLFDGKSTAGWHGYNGRTRKPGRSRTAR